MRSLDVCEHPHLQLDVQNGTLATVTPQWRVAVFPRVLELAKTVQKPLSRESLRDAALVCVSFLRIVLVSCVFVELASSWLAKVICGLFLCVITAWLGGVLDSIWWQ